VRASASMNIQLADEAQLLAGSIERSDVRPCPH
jgi:hypothetical protein